MEENIPKTARYTNRGIETVDRRGRKRFKEYDVVIEQDGSGRYLAHVPELPGCRTQGGSIKEVLKHTTEAIEVYVEHVNTVSGC